MRFRKLVKRPKQTVFVRIADLSRGALRIHCGLSLFENMAWMRSVASSEEVFDEDGDDVSLQNKEWKNNMDKRTQDGFRDGINAGKEASLQAGFDTGYREGAGKMRAVGQLKGIMSALRCWCQVQQPGTPALASITDLLQRVELHEDALMEALRKAQQRAPPSVTETVEEMEDLMVCDDEQRNPDTSEGLSRNLAQSSITAPESLERLLKCCLDLVTDLRLPEELKLHIQKLSST